MGPVKHLSLTSWADKIRGFLCVKISSLVICHSFVISHTFLPSKCEIFHPNNSFIFIKGIAQGHTLLVTNICANKFVLFV